MPLGRRSVIDVLLVCTGNLCRSPYIAARLSHSLPGLTIASAGTAVVAGLAMPAELEEVLEERGIRPGFHRPARLNRGLARRSTLVLTAERTHRIEVQHLLGDDERAFTLLELARSLRDHGSPVGLGVPGVLRLAIASSRQDDGRDYEDDLADPYGRDLDAFRSMANAADEALSVVVPALDTPL